MTQLAQLTLLELGGLWSDHDPQMEQLQQLLAQPLPLRVLRLDDGRIKAFSPLDLSHLTQLEQFVCTAPELSAVFPSQLQQLVLSSVDSKPMLQAVLALQQLRRLTLCNIIAAHDDLSGKLLPRVAQLPALQQLVLLYQNGHLAAAAAHAWSQLPQLSELDISHSWVCGGLSRQQCEAILGGVAASTNLTRLDLTPCAVMVGTCAPCAKLAGLTNLKDLSICQGSELLAPGDALALTALTGLTRLVLHDVGDGVGDGAAAAIAGSCQQLRHLDLSWCNLVSMACLANVRHLTQLTELQLGQKRG